MTGDPAEKSVLSADVDWKILTQQRKMKIKDMRNVIENGILDKFKEINYRNNIVDKFNEKEFNQP